MPLRPILPLIPIAECKVRGVYRVFCRNLLTTVWDGEQFIGIREKFGREFLTGELHRDADPNFGTVSGMEFIEMLPEGIEMHYTVQVMHNGQMVNMIYRPLFEYLKKLDDEEYTRRGYTV